MFTSTKKNDHSSRASHRINFHDSNTTSLSQACLSTREDYSSVNLLKLVEKTEENQVFPMLALKVDTNSEKCSKRAC
ncbi:MAG: hypothetical protein QXF04_01230 [Candidatus Aenigmatarchaeota archaeon]